MKNVQMLYKLSIISLLKKNKISVILKIIYHIVLSKLMIIACNYVKIENSQFLMRISFVINKIIDYI